MLVDAGIVADRKGGGVDEADAATVAQLRMQIGHQRNQDGGHQLDKARIAHQRWKLAAQMTMDILDVIGFERPIVGLINRMTMVMISLGYIWVDVSVVAAPMSANHGAKSGQTAARNHPPNKTGRVNSFSEPPGEKYGFSSVFYLTRNGSLSHTHIIEGSLKSTFAKKR